MDYVSLIQQFGYIAVFIGTIIEGEAVLLLSGFFAQKGYLLYPAVFALGAMGTYASETFIYYMGRWHGRAFMKRRSESWRERYYRFAERLHRHRYLIILFYRFFYGMRTVAPFAIGSSGVRPFTFHSLNLVGTLLWTGLMSGLGYFFGRSVERFFQEYAEYNMWVLGSVIGAVLAYVFYFHWWRRPTP